MAGFGADELEAVIGVVDVELRMLSEVETEGHGEARVDGIEDELFFSDKGDGSVEDGRERMGGEGAGRLFEVVRIERSVVTGTDELTGVKTGMFVNVEMGRFVEFEVGRFVEFEVGRFAEFEVGRFVEVEMGRFVELETIWSGGLGAGRVLGDKAEEAGVFLD
jgi:hypothetical protein